MDNIRKAIKDKGYTQEQFAEILGLKRNSLMKRLRGEVEFKVLEKEKINLGNMEVEQLKWII